MKVAKPATYKRWLAQMRSGHAFQSVGRSRLTQELREVVIRTWVRQYNTERPHHGRDIGNNVLQVDFRPARNGPIQRRRQLGGIVTSYTRDAS